MAKQKLLVQEDVESGRDPLAQSFFVNSADGMFVTAIEAYFQVKDTTLPVTMQIRTMRDGTPTTTILPFGEVDLMPSQVNISDDASVATKFTFPSPVYLKGNTEYAFVLLADTPEYGAWISRMGEEDVTGTLTDENATRQVISQQPLLGSLFKSQNGSTWDASQFEDLKFTMYGNSVYNWDVLMHRSTTQIWVLQMVVSQNLVPIQFKQLAERPPLDLVLL